MPAAAGIQYAAPPCMSYPCRGVLDHPPSRMMTAENTDRARFPRSLLQILLHLRPQAVAQIGAGHAVGDVGAQEARLRAAIMPLALELHAVEALRPGEGLHRVGELDLVARATLLGFQDLEDFRLQDVAAGDRQV